MVPDVSSLERAFQLARSGEVATIDDIKDKLRREGYDRAAVVNGGRVLTLQLRKLISEAGERKATRQPPLPGGEHRGSS
jgi:hypothetical protein